MNVNWKKMLNLTTVVLGSALIPAANAGCGDVNWIQNQQWMAFRSIRPFSTMSTRAKEPDAPAGADIVGMWRFQFVAKDNAGIPDGTVIDTGLAQWHSDGTEFTNSGARKPATQNFCLGVWKKTGPSTYKLNHLALSYDDAGNPNGTANIHEDVTVDDSGDTFTGTFAIDVFDPAGNQVAKVTGVVMAQRFTVD